MHNAVEKKTKMKERIKRFISMNPTGINTRVVRTHNGNLLYTIRPIQDAKSYFHASQGLILYGIFSYYCMAMKGGIPEWHQSD